MADRRMFSKTIIDSDDFLNMPLSTQCLYFHLAMRADDEGFLNNPKKIQRMISATEDDFRVLIGKRYVIPFESGIVVIRHWKIHNYIRSDRFKNTIYQDEAEQLTTDRSGAYVLADVDGDTKKDTPPQSDNTLTTTCLPSDYQVTTTCLPNGDAGKDRLNSIVEDKLNARARASADQIAKEFSLSDPVRDAFDRYLSYLSEIGKPAGIETARAILKKLNGLARSEAEAVEILDNAIRKQWKDIYHIDKGTKQKKNAVGSFGNYEQRDFDYSELEKKMRGYDDA